MFEPFYIEDKSQGTQMRYFCLFPCLVIRSVHLAKRDCLLIAICRFVARRGYPDPIVSENGKNFIEANQLMKLKFFGKPSAEQQVHQNAFDSTEHSVDLQLNTGITLGRSLREVDADEEEKSTNSNGQSETKTPSFPGNCGGGRGNFVLQVIKSCGLHHLR